MSAASHDNDAFAVDLGKGGNLLEAVDAVEPLEVGKQRVGRAVERHLEIDVRSVSGRMEVNVADVGVVIGQHLRDRRHHAWAVRGRDHDCV